MKDEHGLPQMQIRKDRTLRRRKSWPRMVAMYRLPLAVGDKIEKLFE